MDPGAQLQPALLCTSHLQPSLRLPPHVPAAPVTKSQALSRARARRLATAGSTPAAASRDTSGVVLPAQVQWTLSKLCNDHKQITAADCGCDYGKQPNASNVRRTWASCYDSMHQHAAVQADEHDSLRWVLISCITCLTLGRCMKA
jgi:hypothetical protein